jgi:hypothetical protein
MSQRFTRLSREIGTGNAVLYLIARLLSRASAGRIKLYKYYLVAQPVAESSVTPAHRGRSINVREASVDEIRGTDFGRPAAAVEYRLRHRCRCLLAYRGAELLGFQWFSLNDYPEDEVRCWFLVDPAENCAWDFDIFVKPEARALPVFLRLWDHCNALLREQRIERSLSRIDAFNAASLRSHTRLGAANLGWALFVVGGPVQLAAFSSRPWLHLSLSPASIPRWPVSRLARRQIPNPVSDRAPPNP